MRSLIKKVNEDTQLLTIFSPGEAQYFKKEFTGKIRFFYIDISSGPDNGDALLEQALAIDWLQETLFIAICQEGNMGQYAAAIKQGAVDIFPAPIDISFAKRRIKELY